MVHVCHLMYMYGVYTCIASIASSNGWRKFGNVRVIMDSYILAFNLTTLYVSFDQGYWLMQEVSVETGVISKFSLDVEK